MQEVIDFLLIFTFFAFSFQEIDEDGPSQSRHDGHVCNIENIGMEGFCSHIHEVHYKTEADPIDHVSDASGHNAGISDIFGNIYVFGEEEMSQKEEEEEGGDDDQDNLSDRFGPGGAEASPSSGIFRIAKLKKTIPIVQRKAVFEGGFRPLFTPLIQGDNGGGDRNEIDNSHKIVHFECSDKVCFLLKKFKIFWEKKSGRFSLQGNPLQN